MKIPSGYKYWVSITGESICKSCYPKYKKPILLRLSKARNQIERLYYCPYCNGEFYDNYMLIFHMRDCKRGFPVSCELCGKLCKTEGGKKRHVTRMHKNVRGSI
jgi:hypothetical protein